MERFLQRDDVLVRYNNNNNNSQRSFMDPSSSSSSTPRTSFRNTRNAGDGDGVVDFHDVFGGPPRRSSMHETRQSFNEGTDLHSRRFRGDDGEASASSSRQWSGLSERPVFGEEGGGIRRRNTIGDDGEASASSSSRQWSGLSERPVFGEEGGGIRKRNTSGDDFFDDIFRGDESSNSSTPRKIDRDMYSSIPVSRISSPARLLPPRAEPFSSSSLQAQFSLPTKFNKGIDFPTFASPTRSMYSNKDDAANGMNHPYSPSSPQSMFSSGAIQGLDESRNEARPSCRQSPLSMEFSLKSDGSVKVTESETDTEGGSLKKDSCSSDVLPNSTQFHFSIYKWASKGVPQLIPLRNANGSKLKEKYINRCSSSKGRIEGENMFMELPTKTLSDVKFSSPNDNVSANIESNGMVCKKQDIESPLSTSTQDKFEVFQSVKEVVLDVPKSEPLDSFQRSVENIPDNTVISNSREEKNPDSLPDTSLRGKEDEVINKFLEEASKPILRSLFSENDDEQGKAEIGMDVGGKESMAKPTKRSSGNFSIGRNLKNRGGKRTIHNGAEVDKASMQGSPVHMGHNLERNKIKGKVKEFVKIFNQEAPSKRVIEADTQSQSSRWKDAGTPKVEKEVNISTVRADKTLPTPNMDKKKTSLNTSVKVDKIFKQSQKQDSGIDTTSLLFSDTSEQKDSLSSSDGSKAAPPSIDDFFHGNFSIEDISPDEDKLPQTGKDQEDFQASDAKIRQWSSGKEVNIRSLLSTLQYVLWPESGWKPVPLVDIIEGSAVKRAYQKALLCLHPDKLQQKGAAAHQKYVAEKVFDILQEAWIHFNSLGSL